MTLEMLSIAKRTSLWPASPTSPSSKSYKATPSCLGLTSAKAGI